MKTVAIISEYNPFHNGHRYQIDKIREQLGADTAIVAIMSGNYTQRGEIAIMDKWERAKGAVLSGVNLVLELPFPYSISSAEFFARAGVHIASALGVIDYLSFGSELGDIQALSAVADNMLSNKFKDELKRLSESSENENLGYARLNELAYKNVFGVEPPESSANNILALEYIKAIRTLIPNTIKREGASYNDEDIIDSSFQSASAIRKKLKSDICSAKDFVPEIVYNTMIDEYKAKVFPTDPGKLDAPIISYFRLISECNRNDIHDASGGLYNRLINKSYEASDIPTLIDLSATKKYTTARIRRAIWYSYFGVTSSDVKTLPEYTQLLAMDKIGQALLKKIKKTSTLTILTKPSTELISVCGARTKELSDKADFIFQLSKPEPLAASSIYKRTPFVVK